MFYDYDQICHHSLEVQSNLVEQTFGDHQNVCYNREKYPYILSFGIKKWEIIFFVIIVNSS